jgi:hypothetical protein
MISRLKNSNAQNFNIHMKLRQLCVHLCVCVCVCVCVERGECVYTQGR